MRHTPQVKHFTEDGGEFNQIESNLAMICATLAPRSRAFCDLCRVLLQHRSGAGSGSRAVAIVDVQLGKRAAREKIGAAS
jgi:hypothetical protein